MFCIFPYTDKQNKVFKSHTEHWFFWRLSLDDVLCWLLGKLDFLLAFCLHNQMETQEISSYFILIFFTVLHLFNRIVVIS